MTLRKGGKQEQLLGSVCRGKSYQRKAESSVRFISPRAPVTQACWILKYPLTAITCHRYRSKVNFLPITSTRSYVFLSH